MKTEEEYNAEVLQLMRDLYPTLKDGERERAERLFPELKESEDERIRKYLLKLAERCPDDSIDFMHEVKKEDVVAWLEKQGEQKPANKVESKFKVGNWYLCVKNFYGKGVRFDKGHAYHCGHDGCLQEFDSGAHISIAEELYEYFRPWTIQDAKDGDVLYDNNTNTVLIFKSQTCGWIKGYCDFWITKNKFTGTYSDAYGRVNEMDLKPATKEQRDTLLNAMADAGYTFDFEKKELKKIEQKPVWSEEDEKMLGKCIDAASGYYSPEDKQSMKDWLKALKDRCVWKPSEEQMKVLNEIINYVAGHQSMHWNDYVYNILKQFKSQLKRMKGK